MKKIVILTIIIVVIGFIIGLNVDIILLKNSVFNYSLFFFYFNLLIYLLAYGLSFIGFPAFLLVFIYEAFLLGINISIFISKYKFIGILIALLLTISKIIVLFLLMLNCFYYLKYIKHLFNYLFKKNYISKHNLKLYFKKITIISFFLIIIFMINGLIMKHLLIPILNRVL